VGVKNKQQEEGGGKMHPQYSSFAKQDLGFPVQPLRLPSVAQSPVGDGSHHASIVCSAGSLCAG
jgi:hypothetical protein